MLTYKVYFGIFCYTTISDVIRLNHDKMKTKTNIALEGTCNGDVVGGLYRKPRENLQALLFGKRGLRIPVMTQRE